MINVTFARDAEHGEWRVYRGNKRIYTCNCPFDALKLAGGVAREGGRVVTLSAADARMLAQLAIDNNS